MERATPVHLLPRKAFNRTMQRMQRNSRNDMKPSKNHPWRKRHFAPPPPPEAAIWAAGKMVDASTLSRRLIEKEADRQERRRRLGYKVTQYER